MSGALAGARRRVARALEEGTLDGELTRTIARVVAPLYLRPRPLRAPPQVRILCVGGATLGGSGKSRLANALAHALPEAILVGHGYRAGDRRTRFVHPEERVATAGDEALAAARAGLRVVLGPSRQAAVDFASRHAELLVLDGPLLVTHPRRASLLAVDAEEPWGSGAVFPGGDLRAPRAALERAADVVVPVSSELEDVGDLPRPLGLFTALARPERLIRRLVPDVVVSAPDHGPACLDAFRSSAMPVATWVATEKCATHLADLAITAAFPLRILRDTYMARLDRAFVRRIVSLTDCERVGRENTRYDHRSEAGRRAG